VIVTDPPGQHVVGLTAISIFSGLFYGVFARFREQACTLACPYGRVMSSLIDRRTITVTYDGVRGEPRRRIARGPAADQATGDCVDCGRCITVCPTGIDIRNGIQLECVNCTACIDACDGVMRRVQRPTGLIRLTSHERLQAGRHAWWSGRLTAYTAAWAILVAVVVTLLARRERLDVLILRQAGTLHATLPDGTIANFYTVQLFNRTGSAVPFEIRAVEPAGARLTRLGLPGGVGPHALLEGRLLVSLPPERLTGAATRVRFDVRVRGDADRHVDSSFIGPAGAKD
jgi:cytochrome c oxidase accessory protein FixG